MDAPQGRYKVIEKDGRLIVIDNATGQPASGNAAPPRPAPPGRSGGSPISRAGSTPGPASGGSPISTANGMLATWLDGVSATLLRLAVSAWDDQGRAIIHWSWKTNNVEQRWDAELDADQQRRLGRALTAMASFPLFLILFIFGSSIWMFVPLVLTVVPVMWGGVSIAKLRAATNQWRPPRD